MSNPMRPLALTIAAWPRPRWTSRSPVARAAAIGLLGTLALSGLYLGIVSLAESPRHALDLFWEDRWLVIPILLTFGVQAGLYAFVCAGAHLPTRGAEGSA